MEILLDITNKEGVFMAIRYDKKLNKEIYQTVYA